MSVEAPERIWVTREDMAQSWPGAYKVFRASDLEHPECPEYVRADKLEELAAESHEWKDRVRYLSKCIDEKSADEDRLKASLAEAKRENEALREALEAMLEPYEDDPCRHDHHGYCQAHFVQEDCCVAKARATLARNAGGKDAE